MFTIKAVLRWCRRAVQTGLLAYIVVGIFIVWACEHFEKAHNAN